MKSIKQNIRVSLVFEILMIMTGCAAHKIPIYGGMSSAPPPLAGKKVAVLPPAGVGGEVKMALETEQAMDAVFSGEIAGIRFSNGNVLLPLMKEQADAADGLYRQIRSSVSTYYLTADGSATTTTLPENGALPLNYVKGEPKVLIDSDTVAGQKQKRKCNVTIDVTGSIVALAPEKLESPLLKSFDADYVLTAVPFGHYVKTKHILALYGILPFGGYGYMGRSPQGIFALYETESGKKVWEGQIGTQAFNNSDPSVDKLPETSHIVMGAAYLLTGDTETPLSRILSAMAPLKKN